jgi:hypothetical protein
MSDNEEADANKRLPQVSSVPPLDGFDVDADETQQRRVIQGKRIAFTLAEELDDQIEF